MHFLQGNDRHAVVRSNTSVLANHVLLLNLISANRTGILHPHPLYTAPLVKEVATAQFNTTFLLSVRAQTDHTLSSVFCPGYLQCLYVLAAHRAGCYLCRNKYLIDYVVQLVIKRVVIDVICGAEPVPVVETLDRSTTARVLVGPVMVGTIAVYNIFRAVSLCPLSPPRVPLAIPGTPAPARPDIEQIAG